MNRLGISDTSQVEEIYNILDNIDLVLVMSVEPGKGGQKFIKESLDKIEWLKNNKKDNDYLISVDGGINNETSKYVKKAGADIIVVGTYLTKYTIEKEKIKELM